MGGGGVQTLICMPDSRSQLQHPLQTKEEKGEKRKKTGKKENRSEMGAGEKNNSIQPEPSVNTPLSTA